MDVNRNVRKPSRDLRNWLVRLFGLGKRNPSKKSRRTLCVEKTSKYRGRIHLLRRQTGLRSSLVRRSPRQTGFLIRASSTPPRNCIHFARAISHTQCLIALSSWEQPRYLIRLGYYQLLVRWWLNKTGDVAKVSDNSFFPIASHCQTCPGSLTYPVELQKNSKKKNISCYCLTATLSIKAGHG